MPPFSGDSSLLEGTPPNNGTGLLILGHGSTLPFVVEPFPLLPAKLHRAETKPRRHEAQGQHLQVAEAPDGSGLPQQRVRQDHVLTENERSRRSAGVRICYSAKGRFIHTFIHMHLYVVQCIVSYIPGPSCMLKVSAFSPRIAFWSNCACFCAYGFLFAQFGC